MQTITLGDTGETIPVIGFGGMPLSIQGRPDEEQGRKAREASASRHCMSDSWQRNSCPSSLKDIKRIKDMTTVAETAGFKQCAASQLERVRVPLANASSTRTLSNRLSGASTRMNRTSTR